MEEKTKFSVSYFLIVLGTIFFLQWLVFSPTTGIQEISYNSFKEKLSTGEVKRLVILPQYIVGEYNSPEDPDTLSSIGTVPSTPWRLRIQSVEEQREKQFIVSRLPNMADESLLSLIEEAGVDYSGRIEENTFRDFILNWILPFVLIFLLWRYILSSRMNTGGMLNLGKNKAKIQAEKPEKAVSFSDVAGVDEAVEEVKEVVDFLKTPQKYTRLGGKLPKGLLLMGPPGTGKTLLAKAVAGEAGVPFFSISGSDFVEMFVGVGAARVRDLFQQAKKNAPCIIFIDEIDAIGKSRAGNVAFGGGYDERENTLNQLLVEMDGFEQGLGVIIIGATNRPEVLDQALLRPGRFDRQVVVEKPDVRGRVAIFRVHTRHLKLDAGVDLKKLAAQTPGFAGAEIANVCNEAAILAVRNNHQTITMADFEAAIERVVAGLEKKNKLINEKERKIVAYHESGHAIVSSFIPGADQVHKVSIVPRGIGALGYTLQMPLEDRYLLSKSELLGKIKGLLGGRAAEEITFGEVSTGASNDLERVAQLARNMITVYGMSEKLPNLSLVNRSNPGFLGQSAGLDRRSEYIERLIDEEVTALINGCYQEVRLLLVEKRDLLDKMAEVLLTKEVIVHEEIKQLIAEDKAVEPVKERSHQTIQ
ncbi:ATP-dependent zinc metalloprotease FtsH [Pontibacter toksunensis]|uniref:ATP-dependent zinc metalloprotease FtsH n=1 Tax=Pontibacter toksunensis TaxID=1332631 RepID=A0ABW6C0P7_9BACT